MEDIFEEWNVYATKKDLKARDISFDNLLKDSKLKKEIQWLCLDYVQKKSKEAKFVSDLDKVQPEKYDSSSRARTAGINQIAVFENNNGKFLAIKILGIKDDSRGDDSDELHFKYKILS